MTKLAYIVGSYGLISETFIRDTITQISSTEVIDITVVCDSYIVDNYSISGVKVIEAKFLAMRSLGFKLSYRFVKWLKSATDGFDENLRQKWAKQQLIPVFQELKPDIAFIDYGTIAVYAMDTLNTLRVPYIVHFHGADISAALRSAIYRESLGRLLKKSYKLIAASNHIKRLLILQGADPHKIELVRLFIKDKLEQSVSYRERFKRQPTVVFLGRLTPKKNPVALVEAFRVVAERIPEAILTIVGDGEERDKVQQRIQKYGLSDKIRLTGALPQDHALDLVDNSWIYTQHSVSAYTGDQEGFGLSMVEAALLGLPVVATLHNGIPEHVIDGKTGYLVREYDYESMAERLIQLIQNPDKIETMGQAGRENILSLCDNKKREQQLLELFTSI